MPREEKTKVIRVSATVDAAIRSYAKSRNIPVTEAANKLVTVATGRLGALAKYGKKPDKPKRAPRAKKPKAAQPEAQAAS